MRELTKIIRIATSAIEQTYFHLDIDGGDSIYRERVYCYELYHQMRRRWPRGSPFYLNGEVDKSAHPILRQLGADGAKPDLLVHQPGNMGGNHAVIEIKHSEVEIPGIRNDLEKLSLFINRVGYERAIYLIYGFDAANTLAKIQRIADTIPELAHIELWIHNEVGQRAIHVNTL